MVQMLSDTIEKVWDDFTTGTDEDRARMIGRVAGEILVDYIAAKGVTAAVNKLKDTSTYTRLVGKVGTGELQGSEVAKILDNAYDLSTDTRRYIDRFLDRAKEIRKPLKSELKSGGNVAIADIDIDGISKELRAHSKIQNVEDGFIGKPKAPKFKPKTVGHFRDVDTEYKILEEIAKQIGDNKDVTGSIDLFTEFTPCESCCDVLLQFEEKYPNIKLTVYDGKYNVHVYGKK